MEKTTFDLKSEKFDVAAKIKIIKEVRSFTDLGLKEAKELVEKRTNRTKRTKRTNRKPADSLRLRLRLLVPPPPTIALITTSSQPLVRTENVCAQTENVCAVNRECLRWATP
ncbi:hypothetical protein Scep_030727 [Stephania cephalantha]|uniref:Large ribosomal subunit protein bL12 C-terminal domain-containing protein n=1 Tax=Stephania cephalantha TaxID=152367 RepID=A0AAP0HH72_9MAGN